MNLSIGIIIPTVGSKHLEQCINSVLNQTYENIKVYLFVDGVEAIDNISDNIEPDERIKSVILAENVGANGWYGHRVYAAASFLTNTDIICYLDEDNWMEPDHIESLVNVINKGNDWAYSLRNIYDKNGNYLFRDDCESLGKWPTYCNQNSFHIDTSCFAVKRDVAVKIGHTWYGQWGADRKFFTNLRTQFRSFDCTGQYTVSYRLDGNANSVNKEFFERGNAIHAEKYQNNYPWRKVNG